MKFRFTYLFIILIFSFSYAKSGKRIFLDNGCGSCHKETISTIGPSVEQIAKAYNGNIKRMKLFLLGKAKPILDNDSQHLMAKFLKYTRKLSEKELDALARYLTTIPENKFEPFKKNND